MTSHTSLDSVASRPISRLLIWIIVGWASIAVISIVSVIGFLIYRQAMGGDRTLPHALSPQTYVVYIGALVFLIALLGICAWMILRCLSFEAGSQVVSRQSTFFTNIAAMLASLELTGNYLIAFVVLIFLVIGTLINTALLHPLEIFLGAFGGALGRLTRAARNTQQSKKVSDRASIADSSSHQL
jgi:hypothetical protein